MVRSGATGQDFDLIRDDKGTVKADAELADQRGILLLIAGELIKKLCRTRFGDGTQVVDDLFSGHANTVVFDRQRLGIGVKADRDRIVAILGRELRFGDGSKTQPIDGIGGVQIGS